MIQNHFFLNQSSKKSVKIALTSVHNVTKFANIMHMILLLGQMTIILCRKQSLEQKLERYRNERLSVRKTHYIYALTAL